MEGSRSIDESRTYAIAIGAHTTERSQRETSTSTSTLGENDSHRGRCASRWCRHRLEQSVKDERRSGGSAAPSDADRYRYADAGYRNHNSYTASGDSNGNGIRDTTCGDSGSDADLYASTTGLH